MRREMMAMAGPAVASALNEEIAPELLPARKRFRDLAIERIMMLESLRIRVTTGQQPRTPIPGIVALAHKIAGSAGSLGYATAGVLAASIDQLSRDQAEVKLPLNELWRQIEPRLIALMDELEALLDE